MKILRHFTLGLVAAASLAALAQDPIETRMRAHVEKIIVIDSINVNKDAFFNKYRIRPSAGRIMPAGDMARELRGVKMPPNFVGEPFTGFTNEYRDYMIWAQEDTTGYLRLAETVKLGDGTWDIPSFTPTVLNFGYEEQPDSAVTANAAFPFMEDDGQTLYFAADNEKSLGGYDIFVAMKDPNDGSFLIPNNIGMPFNSPFNDYMMVLDKQTGVGWWASDRNGIEDMVTIYIYALSDERVNVDPEDELLENYITLSGWQSLLDEEGEALREKFLAEIRGIEIVETKEPEFSLPMPKGKTYRFYSDFKDKEAASLMKRYLSDKSALDEKRRELADLRASFSEERDATVAARIKNLEQQIRSGESQLNNILSQIYKKERGER